jgi:hypothetical protein
MLEGTHFVSAEVVEAKPTELLNSLTEDDLHCCSEQWHHHMRGV